MCTSCQWTTSGQGVFTVRNMDWHGQMPTALWVMPAGREQVAANAKDPNPAKWTSKYGSVATEIFNLGTGDGMNEKGLHAAMLYLTPSDYGTRDPKLPAISISLWVQYYLDNFATVAEAVADFEKNPYQVVTLVVEGQPGVVHLQVTDATGDAAVFEVIDGKMNIYHGEQCQVLTNLPPLPEQLANLKNYEGFGGTKPLPGTTASDDRFVRATFYRNALPKAQSGDEAVAYLMSVAHNAAQPYGTSDPERPFIAPTIWRSLSDQTNLRYLYEPSIHALQVWLDYKNLDFSVGAPNKKVNLAEMVGRMGEQSAALVDTEPFPFVLL